MKKQYKSKIEEKDGKIYQTTEVPDGFRNVNLPKKSWFENGDFVTIFQEALKEIILKGDLSKGELRLLVYLIATTGKDNSVCIDLNELSIALKTAKSNVSSALTGLVERNIILRRNGYRYAKQPLPIKLSVNYDQFNYDLAYNGKVSQYKKVRTNHPDILSKDGLKLEKYTQTSILEQIKTFDDDKD